MGLLALDYMAVGFFLKNDRLPQKKAVVIKSNQTNAMSASSDAGGDLLNLVVFYQAENSSGW